MTSTLISSDDHFMGKHADSGKERNLSASDESQSTTYYTVQDRDTLRSIAVNFNTTTSTLKKLNKMTSTMIFPGQSLLVPEVDDFLANEDLPTKRASIGNDGYDFLSSLSSSLPTQSTTKPFKDLIVVSSDHHSAGTNRNTLNRRPLLQLPSSSDRQRYSSSDSAPSGLKQSVSSQDTCLERNSSIKRLVSVDSCQSEPLEENFVKMNAEYITTAYELVHGVFLTTPTSIMFDPDLNCRLVKEQGCEKFGIMCDLSNVISIAVYKDTRNLAKHKSVELSATSSQTSIGEKHSDKEEKTTEKSDDVANEVENDQNKETEDKDTNNSDDNKLMFEFPFLHSLVKTVEDYLPGLAHLIDDKPTSPSENQKVLYLCIISQTAMMRTFSVLTAISDQPDKVEKRENEVKEAWFQIPADRSDQLFAFFMQWSPDSYALDFAEENGFIDASTIEEKTEKRKTSIVKEEVRSRSSTNSSLEFIEDYFGEAEIQKEWEMMA